MRAIHQSSFPIKTYKILATLSPKATTCKDPCQQQIIWALYLCRQRCKHRIPNSQRVVARAPFSPISIRSGLRRTHLTRVLVILLIIIHFRKWGLFIQSHVYWREPTSERPSKYQVYFWKRPGSHEAAIGSLWNLQTKVIFSFQPLL